MVSPERPMFVTVVTCACETGGPIPLYNPLLWALSPLLKRLIPVTTVTTGFLGELIGGVSHQRQAEWHLPEGEIMTSLMGLGHLRRSEARLPAAGRYESRCVIFRRQGLLSGTDIVVQHK
jgi:hypothetical protein